MALKSFYAAKPLHHDYAVTKPPVLFLPHKAFLKKTFLETAEKANTRLQLFQTEHGAFKRLRALHIKVVNFCFYIGRNENIPNKRFAEN